jgi:hypothetical protein
VGGKPAATLLKFSLVPTGFMTRHLNSRVAITALLVAGLFLANTTTGLALSGISGSGNAGSAQYPLGATGEQPTGEQPTGEQPTGEQPTPIGESNANGVQPVQATRQAEGAGNELPFTGLAAIPLLLLGSGMAVAGFVLRSRRRLANRPRHDH